MSEDMKRVAVVIGAGPAGLTAASELLDKTDIHPLVLEQSDEIGGISKTVPIERRPAYRPTTADGSRRSRPRANRPRDAWPRACVEDILPAKVL